MFSSSITTEVFDVLWTLVRLFAPVMDVYFVLSDYQQARVLVGEFWMIWLASAFHGYLSQYNYDIVFGQFKDYFQITYD